MQDLNTVFKSDHIHLRLQKPRESQTKLLKLTSKEGFGFIFQKLLSVSISVPPEPGIFLQLFSPAANLKTLVFLCS